MKNSSMSLTGVLECFLKWIKTCCQESEEVYLSPFVFYMPTNRKFPSAKFELLI